MPRRSIAVSPFQAGLALGLGAALVQAWFHVLPPVAYGVCLVCHPRDLVNWIANRLLATGWDVGIASTSWPVLTAVGIVLGALLAAHRHGELRARPARSPWPFATAGFLTIQLGLVLGACPIRLVLLTAYGDVLGAAAWACVAAGIGAGVLALRWNARRAALGGALQ